MYCPSCGIDSVEGLKYCKRCGVSLATPQEGAVSRDLPIGLVVAFLIVIAVVMTTGLMMPFAITKELSRLGFSESDMMALFILDAGVTLAVVAMLIRLLSRIIGQNTRFALKSPKLEPRQIEQAAARITGRREPLVSVTENTTRSFEKRNYDNVNSWDRVGQDH
jgi:uncharacterized paraquat-inducible protein A